MQQQKINEIIITVQTTVYMYITIIFNSLFHIVFCRKNSYNGMKIYTQIMCFLFIPQCTTFFIKWMRP